MIYKKGRIICSLFAAILMCSVCFPGISFGEELENNFVLTGIHTDGFSLTSNNHKIFDVDGILPGDEIHAVVEAQNFTDEALDLALLSIDSLMYDTSLFDALKLKITHKGEVLYEGAFATDTSTVTDYITVDAGDCISLDVSVTVPQKLDNDYQGMEMESAWVFEARHPGNKIVEHDDNVHSDQSVSPVDKEEQSGIKTGAELPRYNHAIIFAVVGVIFIGLGLLLIFKRGKKEN